MEITSANNETVKKYTKLHQKKYRIESGKFILEGFKTIKEAYQCGIAIEHVIIQKEHITDYKFINQDIIIETNEIVLKKLSTTESAPPAVAIALQKEWDIEEFKNMTKVVLLEGIKDSGNLGTIIRSAVAFGCDGIVLFGDCTDIYNPKCVRSAVGNLWKIPIIHITDIYVLKNIFEKFSKIATLPRSNNLLKNYTSTASQLVMFGSEAEGLSEELINISTDSIKIEMKANVESLNLASSASVVMYELFT